MMRYITRSPARCVACGHQLGQQHAHRCPFKRFT
jgi:DNA-directed RNA polymerase subunit N (RpoN/RPB10)